MTETGGEANNGTTPVIPEPVEEDETDTVEEPVKDEVVDPTNSNTDTSKELQEDAFKEETVQTFDNEISINAAESVNPVPITFYEYETDKVTEDDQLSAGTIVVPHYLSGEENGQATGSGNLVFQLEVQDGWVAADLTGANLQYRIQKTNEDGTTAWLPTGAEGWANLPTDGDGYKIDLNGDNGLKGNEKKKCFTGPIEIKVVATKNTATLDASAVTGGVYFVENGERGDLISSTKAGISLTEEITLLVKAEADDTVELNIHNGSTDGTAAPMTRGNDVLIDEVTWTEFTIDPKTLDKYDDYSTVTGTSFVVTKVPGDDPTFTYYLDDDVNMKYSFGAVSSLATNVPDTAEIHYFTLKTDPSLDAPDATTKKTYLTTGEGASQKRNVLVFTVTADTDAEIAGVKAELAKDSAPTKVLQTIEANSNTYGANPAVTYYAIDLGEVDSTLITEAVTLTLKADTTFKSEDDEFGNHKITFTGDLDNVEIKQNSGNSVSDQSDFDNATALPTSFDTDEGTLNFAVKAKDGYAITNGTNYNPDNGDDIKTSDDVVVTVSYTKRYQLTLASDHSTKNYVERKVENKEFILEDVGSGTGIYKLEDRAGFVTSNALTLAQTTVSNGDNGWIGNEDWQISDGDKATYDEGSAGGNEAAYSYKDITINIRTTTANNQSGHFVVNSDELEYAVETGNGVEPGDTANKYDISEEADFVVLNITSPGGAPTVVYKKVGNADETFAESKMVKDGDIYKVKIPVTSLNGSDTTETGNANATINSTITITRGKYTFTVKTGASEDTFAGKLKIGTYGPETYAQAKSDGKNQILKGETVPVVLYATTGTEFKTVKVVTGSGDDATTEEITLGEDKSTVELSLAMTDAVEVQITTNDIYDVTLTRDPATTSIEKDENGVYVIPVGGKNIRAALKNGATAQTIAYAKLYDGDQEAATKVVLEDGTGSKDVAKIASIDSKDTGVLRLDLAVKKGNKLTVVSSVQIRQEQAASKMSITNPYDGSAVTEFNQAPDTAAAEYNVKADEGSLTFSDSDVVMELAADASRTTGTQATIGTVDGKQSYTITNNDVEIQFVPTAEEKQLKITAKPSVTGDKSYVLRFYNKARRAEAAKTNAADRICAVEGGTIEVKIASPAVKNAGFTAEALDATNTALKIQVGSDNVALNPTNANNVFYRVTLDSKDKLGTGITERTQYYQRTGESQVLVFTVNPDMDAKGEDYSDPQEFHPTVELVQTTEGGANGLQPDNEAAAKAQGGRNKLAKSDAITLTTSTKEARYEHELTLTPAKATVYLGQESTVVTAAQFGEKTGFAQVEKVEFVNTKTNKALNSSDPDSWAGMTATKNNKGEVMIAATTANNNWLKNYPEDYKNLGLKVYAKTAGETMSASAVLSLSVVAGVNDISFENGQNQSIFKQPDKAATLKVKAVLNSGVKENAPKKKQFVYALGDMEGDLPGDKNYKVPSAQVMANVTVNAKNGTVTVKKDFVVDTKNEANNKFTVVATETFSGTKGWIHVTVTEKAQAVSRIVIVNEDGKVVAANGVLRADDFYDGTIYKKLYVRALSGTAGTKRAYDAVGGKYAAPDDYMTGVKYTSNAKSVLSVDPTNGELKLLKASNKPVKLTVASADGSKDKGQTIEVAVQSYSDVALQMWGNAVGVNTTGKEKDPVVKYDGVMNAKLTLYPMVKVNGKWIDAPNAYFKNFNIKIGKAKKLKLEKTATHWEIVKTDAVSTVTISDKTNKSVSSTYEITQNPAAPTGVKALKVKSLTKLTQPMIENARNAQDAANGKIKLQYQLTGTSKGLYSGQWIMLTPDYTKMKKVANIEEWRRSRINFLDNNNSKLVRIDANDNFEFDLDMWRKTNEQRIPGSYTLIATAGTYKNGEFVPATKGANIKIKIPGKAPKALSLKLNGNYNLDESGAPVSIGTGISSGLGWELSSGNAGNRALNVIDPETGKPNNFTKYFKVVDTADKDSNGNAVYMLGFKDGIKLDDIAKLRENSKDCQGYVTVETSDQRQDMLINVTLTDSEIISMTKDSYKGAEATVQFYAGADQTKPIEIAGISIDQTASQGTPSFAKTGTHVEADNKSVKIKLGAAEKDNSYEVTFKVLAANSAYAVAKNNSNNNVTINDQYVQQYGRTVTATFYVADPAKAQGAVWFEPVDKNTGLAFTAFSEATYNKAKNTYSLDIKQESAIDGAKVSAIKIGTKDANGNAFAGAGIMNIKAKAGNTDVFTLTLERDKFLKLTDDEGAVLERGTELEIPVELTYSNREIPAETVYVYVTMPDPMNVDAAVEAAKGAVAEVEQIKVIDFQNKTVSGGDVKTALQNKVNEVLMKAVPLDAVADINLPIALAEVTSAGDNPVTTWEAAINIKEKKADKTAKWTYTLKFAPEYEMLEASDVAAKIAAITIDKNTINGIANNDHKLDNDYSADMLKADILKLLAKAEAPNNVKSLPENLNLVVKNFKIKKATTTANGSVKADIAVYDAITKRESKAVSIGNATEDFTAKTAIVIEKLGTIKVNADKIADAVQNLNAGVGIDYQKVIYDTLNANGASLQDVEAALETAILTAATRSIRNSGVTVDFKVIEIAAGNASGYENAGINAAGDSRNVVFKLPTGQDSPTGDGLVEFKLLVKQDGMKDYLIDKTGGNKIVVLPANADGVKIFQTLTEAATNVAKTTGDDKIFTSAPSDSSEGEMATGIDKTTTADIAAEVEKRVKTLISGVGLEANAEVTLVTETKTGTEATDMTLGGAAALYAHGTITLTDSLERLGTGDANTKRMLKFVVQVPAGDVATVSDTDIKIEKVVGSTKTVLTADSSSVPAVDVGFIGTDTTKIQFTTKLVGYWLTEADNDFTYSITDTSDGAPDSSNKLNEGFGIANGILTIIPSEVDTSLKDGTVKTVRIKIAHNKRLKGETDDTGKNARVYKRDVKIKFTTPTTAKTLLEAQTDGTNYDWNATTPIKASYEKNESDAWVIVNEDTLKTSLISKANNWLKAAEQGHSGFTLTVKDLAFDNATTPTKATFKFNVARTGDTAIDTASLDLVIEKTAKQLKAEADALADEIVTACASLSAVKDPVTDFAEADAKTSIEGASGVSAKLSAASATVTVTECIAPTTSGETATVKFKVTIGGQGSVEKTISITVSDS